MIFSRRRRVGPQDKRQNSIRKNNIFDTPSGALIVCNGFKDPEYLSCAALANRLDKRVVIVIEKMFELDSILDLARDAASMPMIGFRVRLQARGAHKALRIDPGKATGWNARTYPFVDGRAATSGSVLLPWRDQSIRYVFEGGRLAPKPL